MYSGICSCRCRHFSMFDGFYKDSSNKGDCHMKCFIIAGSKLSIMTKV